MTRPRKVKVRSCVFCSPRFAVIRDKKQNVTKPTTSSIGGIKCTKCGRFACDNCLMKLISAIPQNNWDNWCRNIHTYLKTKSIHSHFVGHCCELKVMKKPCKEQMKPIDSDIPLCNGDLFLIEFGLLIQTSFISVDIHLLSNDVKYFEIRSMA